MAIQGSGWSAVTGGLAVAKACDSCKSSAASLFCRADAAFLCLACDARIHTFSSLSTRHERVWMCEVCEQAPAAVTCKADAAVLCTTCDNDIHSANPLSRRHDRLPVEPFFDSAESLIVNSTAAASSAAVGLSLLIPNNELSSNIKDIENDSAANWLIPNPDFNPKLDLDIVPEIIKSSAADVFFPEMDSLLEFDYQNPIHQKMSGTDSVVPVQPDPLQLPSFNLNRTDQNFFDLDFCRSKLSSSFSYPAQSFSQSVSSSSLDVGVVPDGNSMSDISYPFGRYVKSSVSDPTASQPTIQLCGFDREARVLRYREKRKNRKFQKTIRYASRKAYAETRPRIKGRFAKRTETDVVNHIYSSNPGDFISEPSSYGVVPTF